MVNLVKETTKYKFLGFSFNLNPNEHNIENIRSIQNQIWGKIYTREELDLIQEFFNKGLFNINISEDFVLLEYTRPAKEIVEQGGGSGLVVNELLERPIETQITILSNKELNLILSELKNMGVIAGSEIIAEKANIKSWKKVTKKYMKQYIPLGDLVILALSRSTNLYLRFLSSI